ncbi:hypothetical protein ACIRVK_07895 [Streptomyces sp. NPDC101152]|uniref:glycosyltransferase family 39 protein n=1 Tax=Streptomyces sp. NPDC101152 TaxID=3366116 RepID=UPI0038133158
MLVIGLWHLDRGGMWGDESVTFLVGRRTVPQIWRLLHSVDAVHGLYYLFMHLVLTVRADEVALRLPSVCGAAVSAGLVGVLGLRLAGPRVGLWSGLLYACTPLIGHYAQEGRSYAIVSAGVIGSTLLLVTGLEAAPSTRPWPWRRYGAVLAVTCLLHEFAVLAVCAHAVTLLLARAPRRVWLGWGRAVVAVGVVLAPLAWVSHGQVGQVGWLVAPDRDKAEELVRALAVTPSGVVFWTSALLAVLGALSARRVGAVAVPLLVLPPALLMGVSQIQPLYHERYVLYAFAGAPLLVAAGGEWLASVVARLPLGRPRSRPASHDLPVHNGSGSDSGRPRGADVPRAKGPSASGPLSTGHASDVLVADDASPDARRSPLPAHRPPRVPLLTLTGVLAVAVVFLHDLPLYRHDRSPAHRPENLAAVSALAARDIRPGDPVLFVPSFWRITASAYPAGFRQARDIALGEPGASSGTLTGREVGARDVADRLARADRVWVVGDKRVLRRGTSPGDAVERAELAALKGRFTPRWQYVSGRVALRLYVRRAPAIGSSPLGRP